MGRWRGADSLVGICVIGATLDGSPHRIAV